MAEDFEVTTKIKKFFSDLYQHLELGYPIASALEHLAAIEEKEDFAQTINSIKMKIEAGSLLSEALAESSILFNKKILNSIKSSEDKGTLTQSLKDISNG